MKRTVYIGLGSNQGDSESLLNRAIDLIEQRIAPVVKRSSFYQTKPWGFEASQDFVNAVIQLTADDEAEEILKVLMQIEEELGRNRSLSEGYTSRTMDLDILGIDDVVLSTKNLIVPHPKMHERAFVLVPFAEICNDWVHPVENQTVEELISALNQEDIQGILKP